MKLFNIDNIKLGDKVTVGSKAKVLYHGIVEKTHITVSAVFYHVRITKVCDKANVYKMGNLIPCYYWDLTVTKDPNDIMKNIL